MIKTFKVPEDTRTPEQKEEAKKRLEEMIESWKKFEQEYPEVAVEMYCDWFSFCLKYGKHKIA